MGDIISIQKNVYYVNIFKTITYFMSSIVLFDEHYILQCEAFLSPKVKCFFLIILHEFKIMLDKILK